MSVIGSNILAGASGQGGGYNLTKSLRFRRSATAYLNRTPASAGNRKTWTWSAWVKLGSLDVTRQIFGTGAGATHAALVFEAGNTLFAFSADAGQTFLRTSQVFRDPSAWYHVVWAEDTTQATASNRSKLYVNGVQITAFSTANYPSLDFQGGINNNVAQFISSYDGSNWLYDGYLAEVNFIDGTALTPSSFGETSTTTGVWIPKKYTGTYGTNGFYLPFTNTASTSTLGNDFSGNSNTWTVNNISLTSGSTYDSMTDVPTLTSATTANYAVWNPLILARNFDTNPQTITNGNLVSQFTSNTTAGKFGGASTIGVTSGKWYCEIVVTEGGTYPTYTNFGITGDPLYNATVTNASIGQQDYSVGWYNANGNVYRNGSSLFSGSTQGSPYTAMIALDVSAGKVYFGFGGTWINSANPASGTGGFDILAVSSTPTGQYFITCFFASTGMQGSYALNCGQQPFAHTPPTGFVALNTYNLPTPTIGATASTTANKYMDVTLYTGNGTGLGSTQTISNGNFQPDFIWIKSRSTADYHNLNDSVRGIVGTGSPNLFTNTTDAEATFTGYGVSALTSTGFTLIGNGSYTNNNGTSYVGWQWRASNTTAVTNTSGSITSTVSASTTAGFSIVTYTGNGTAGATVGHGLGVAPSMIIVKRRDAVAQWDVYHTSIGATGRLYLNATDATNTSSAPWNNTAPTSSVFTVGTASDTNQSSSTIVAYCFAPVAGYSAFGSYVGNGSSDGTFVYTGFRPRFIMVKRTDVANWWQMYDTSRNTYNTADKYLGANVSDAEYTASSPNDFIDFNSNGFKIRGSNNAVNANGGTYIYMAFAEVPYKFSNAR